MSGSEISFNEFKQIVLTKRSMDESKYFHDVINKRDEIIQLEDDIYKYQIGTFAFGFIILSSVAYTITSYLN